ncbi:MAG: hypothetical protein RIB86_03140, partial [Imperialibacter sp.]
MSAKKLTFVPGVLLGDESHESKKAYKAEKIAIGVLPKLPHLLNAHQKKSIYYPTCLTACYLLSKSCKHQENTYYLAININSLPWSSAPKEPNLGV